MNGDGSGQQPLTQPRYRSMKHKPRSTFEKNLRHLRQRTPPTPRHQGAYHPNASSTTSIPPTWSLRTAYDHSHCFRDVRPPSPVAHTRRRGGPSWGAARRPPACTGASPAQARGAPSRACSMMPTIFGRPGAIVSHGGSRLPAVAACAPAGSFSVLLRAMEAAWTWCVVSVAVTPCSFSHALSVALRLTDACTPSGLVPRGGRARAGVSAFRAGFRGGGGAGCAAESRENGWMGLANEWAEKRRRTPAVCQCARGCRRR